MTRSWVSVSTIVIACAIACEEQQPPPRVPRVSEPAPLRCPEEMARVEAFCVDKWEASLVFADTGAPFSPFETVKGRKVRAESREGVVPQAYVSRDEAEAACVAAGKRLCLEAEWVRACKGPEQTSWPYGPTRIKGTCNDAGIGPLGRMPKSVQAPTMDNMNHPKLNQMSDTVAKTGSFSGCRSGYGTFDMVGNVHEWVHGESVTDAKFLGGYYLDVTINGDGCDYKTTRHEAWYHDYSIGFRCCKDAER
jgi:sulfatase modifying factor 1